MPAALVDEFEITELPPPFARFDAFDPLPTLCRPCLGRLRRYNSTSGRIRPTCDRPMPGTCGCRDPARLIVW